MKIKQIIVRTLLILEICVVGYLYIFGVNGLQALQVQRNILLSLSNTSVELQREIDILNSEIAQWGENDFYKEKIAREHLHMARKGDKLFYIEP